MITIAIIDDEASEREKLTAYFEQMSQENGIELRLLTFDNGKTLLFEENGSIDLYCFDIELHGDDGRDGIDYAKEIRAKNPSAVIVFITNLAQMAIRGYEVQAVDFLLKPLSYYAFSLKMQTIFKLIHHNQPVTIVVSSADMIYKLDARKLLYVEVNGHYLYYHLEDRVFRQKAPLKELEAKLEGLAFFRCNNCYLVNLKYVDGVSADEVLIGQERLKISRPRKKEFMQKLAQYMGGTE